MKSQYGTSNEESDAWILNDGNGRKYDLEERLLVFAAAVMSLSEMLPSSRAGNHVAEQILRSGTSAFPNHGEAESAESREDFIHKLRVCLKELRETQRWARLIARMKWLDNDTKLRFVLNESDELIRIFNASVKTARENGLKQKRSYNSG